MNMHPDQLTIESFIEQLQVGTTLPQELLEIFAEEADEHLREIYDGLGRLQNNLDDRAAFASVRRATHTLKGAAGAVNLIAATRLAHRMEDLLDQLVDRDESATQSQIQLFLKTADQLQALTHDQAEPAAAAEMLCELHQEYLTELKDESETTTANPNQRRRANDWGGTQDPSPCAPSTESSAAASSTAASSTETSGTNQPVQFLRVPLQQVDNVVNLLNEMMVNRSEFQKQLNDFAARIDEIQLTMSRLRDTTQLIEDFQSGTSLARPQSSLMPMVASPSAQRFAAKTQSANRQSNLAANPGDWSDFDSLEFERYNEFQLLSQSLAEADSDALIMAGEFRKIKNSFTNLLRRQQQLNRDAQYGLMKIRMVPIADIVPSLQRVVRNVSGKLNKSVQLNIVGERIELDKTVLDTIVDPLLHLIRNAIDHGVESQETRLATGKPETAQLTLTAFNRGTQVTLQLADDGAGIQLEKVRQKAIELQWVEEIESLSSDQLHALIFKPGFSTANQLTDVSGRGIGMDVVSDTIRRLKGSIRVESQPGCGTTFTIQLPTTLGVSRVVMVEIAGQTYGIPLESIQQTGRLDLTAVTINTNRATTLVGDQEIRLIELATYLGLTHQPNLTFSKSAPTLLLTNGAHEIVVTVDSVLGTDDIVIQSLGDHLKRVRGIVGATMNGDGSVIPILDMTELMSDATDAYQPLEPAAAAAPLKLRKLAMVIDDSISVRRVTEHSFQLAGWDVVTAKDGVDALDKMAELKRVIDVFLTDMEMPRMDGLELTRQIREQPEFSTTPIVMVTSRSSEKHRQKAFEAGATDFVVKPFNDEKLLNLLTQLVGQ